MNARMSDLREAFESAGFTNVSTVLSSGNVVFDARAASEGALERKAEAAMMKRLGRSFLTIVRSLDMLRQLLSTDPYAEFRVGKAKRIVTFLRAAPAGRLALPTGRDGARILACDDRSVFTVYLPTPKGPVFMTLIQETLGNEVTTRTWETVTKVARA
jgi:uncharacterized protein (DUF1697 family)